MTPEQLKEAAKIVEALDEEIENVSYHTKTGDHIQISNDKIYFSIVGINCNLDQFEEYEAWEESRQALKSIIAKLQPKFYKFNFKHMGTNLEIEPKNQ